MHEIGREVKGGEFYKTHLGEVIGVRCELTPSPVDCVRPVAFLPFLAGLTGLEVLRVSACEAKGLPVAGPGAGMRSRESVKIWISLEEEVSKLSSEKGDGFLADILPVDGKRVRDVDEKSPGIVRFDGVLAGVGKA